MTCLQKQKSRGRMVLAFMGSLLAATLDSTNAQANTAMDLFKNSGIC